MNLGFTITLATLIVAAQGQAWALGTTWELVSEGYICSRDSSVTYTLDGANGWAATSLDVCKVYCEGGSVPNGASSAARRADCEYVIFDHNHNPGWCQLASSCPESSRIASSTSQIWRKITPTISQSGRFSMLGDCDVQGDCVSSKNYPRNYGDRESCSIRVWRDSNLNPGNTFEVEAPWDKLSIDGVDMETRHMIPYHIKIGEDIEWSTDVSGTRKGWELCFEPYNTDIEIPSLERVVGLLQLDGEDNPYIEIWDGTVLQLGSLDSYDVRILKRDDQVGRYVLFEGYRRGMTFEVTEVVRRQSRHGHYYEPYSEYVQRPPVIEGVDTALVVRLIVNGTVGPDTTQDQIRSEVFGSNGDAWNINLFERCSHGSYKIIPFSGTYGGAFDVSGGVMDLEVGDVPGNNIYDLLRVASGKLPYDGSVDFIMFVAPDGYYGKLWDTAAAMAWTPGRFSTFRSWSILNPFVVGHELGHSLGLKHSGDYTDSHHPVEYGDHTCLMGNGYVDSEEIRRDFDENTHCFNNHKNWRLGWYADRRQEWSPTTHGQEVQEYFLVGLGDYAFSDDSQTVVLKIGDDYIGFNRISGVSSDVKEYQDQVTIQREDRGKNSSVEAHLVVGDIFDSEDIPSWRIYVEYIDIKPEGEASTARIVVGSVDEVNSYISMHNLPVNCKVDKEKSAATCTEQCGAVPAVSQDAYPAMNGGSCGEYYCHVNDGFCELDSGKGVCDDETIENWSEAYSNLTQSLNETDDTQSPWDQLPEDAFSTFTCYFNSDHMKFDLLVSGLHSYFMYDFSSTAQIEEEKKITFTLLYAIGGTSNPSKHESKMTFSNTSLAENLAQLLGMPFESVFAYIDREADTAEITIFTNQHADLEERLNHKCFVHRLLNELKHDLMFVDNLQLQDYQEETLNSTEKDGDDDQDNSLLKEIFSNTLYLLAFASVSLFILGCVCLCCYLNRDQKILEKTWTSTV